MRISHHHMEVKDIEIIPMWGYMILKGVNGLWLDMLYIQFFKALSDRTVQSGKGGDGA